ncbi:MAG: hypothetical protein JNK87_40850 [Bryobacterales bacterium]|nr:hypothetical protein [Bryobacterales bacterium]
MKISGYCCSRCGEFRRVLLAACACGMVPNSYVEQAKSLILSTEYEVGDTWRGRSPQDLVEAAEKIRRGTFVFDPLEVSEVAAFLEYREREIQSIEMLPFLAPMLAGVIWMVLMLFIDDIRTKVALTAGAGVVWAACAAFQRHRRQPATLPTAEEYRQRAEFWLAERRALDVTPAQAPPTERQLPAALRDLFAKYSSIRLRFADVEIASRYLDVPSPSPFLVIGHFYDGQILIHRETGAVEVREDGVVTMRSFTLDSFIDFNCSQDFRHLLPRKPGMPSLG